MAGRMALALLLAAGLARAEDAEAKERGDRLFAEAKEAVRERRYDDAERLLEEALPLFEAADRPVAAAWIVSWVGTCRLQRAEYASALEARADALRRMRAVYGEKDDLNVSLSLNNVATCYGELGRTDEAIAAMEEALAMNRRLFEGNRAEIARSLNNLGQYLHDAARYEDAIRCEEESLAMWRALGDERQVARALSNLGVSMDAVGRSREAFPLHEESLAIRDRLSAGDDPEKAISLNNLGLCLRALGRTSEALACHEKSLTMRERLYPRGHPSVATCLNNIAACLNDLGRPADALPLYERAHSIQKSVRGDVHPDTARSLNNLGACLRNLGRPADALPLYEEALQAVRQARVDAHPDLLRALNNLGRCLAALGRCSEAEPLLREAVDVGRHVHPDGHRTVAYALGSLGECLLSEGRAEEALRCTREALAIQRDVHDGDHPDVALALNDVALCLMRLGRDDEGLEVHGQAVEMARRLKDPATHLLAANLGVALVDRGRPADAIPYLAEAIAQIEALRQEARALDDVERADYFQHLKRYLAFTAMVRAQCEMKRPDEALRYLERGRARGFLDLLERSRFDPVAEAERRARLRRDADALARLDSASKALADAEAEVGRLTYALATARADTRELARDLAAAREVHQQAARERAQLVRNVVPMARPDPPEALREGLAADEILLVYEIQEGNSFLIVVPAAGDIEGHRLHWPDDRHVDESTLAEAVEAYRAAILGRREARDLGARLFGALVPEPARERIAKAARVYLVPHASLHRLPFETLVDAKGRYWIESGPAIVYGPSGSVLLWCKRRAAEQFAQDLPYELVALGDPAFGAGERPPGTPTLLARAGPLVALPGTRREVLAIRDVLKEGRVAVLLGEEASKARLFELAPQARMLHLATHQIVDESDGGSFSRLALALPQAPTPEDDGFLRLHELFERWRDRLSGCSLVVLSACDTQAGPLQKDEGIYALPLGFLFAGCPSVVGSLWRVDDESTADLMGAFYRGVGSGLGKLDAFVAARKELCAKRKEPYYWAPFVFIGEPK